MNRKLSRRAFCLASVALAACASGCGVKQYPVTGTVKYNGKVLAKPDGKIVFLGPDGSQAEATIGEDGTYSVDKVTAGTNKVAVYYKNLAFKPVARPHGAPTGKDRPTLSSPYLTPEKYADPETSELSVEVKEGTVFNVDMIPEKHDPAAAKGMIKLN